MHKSKLLGFMKSKEMDCDPSKSFINITEIIYYLRSLQIHFLNNQERTKLLNI